MIKIAIQDSYIPDKHATQLVDACRSLGISYECFGLIPFSDSIIGGILEDKTSIIIPFGATKILHLYYQEKLPKNWVIWHDKLAFNQAVLAEEPSSVGLKMKNFLLNGSAEYKNWPDCADDNYNKWKFVKPVDDLKLFNGQALDPMYTLREQLALQTTDSDIYNHNELIMFADFKEINEEWRCFVVKNEVVISQYKKEGRPFVSNVVGNKDKFAITVLARTFNPLSDKPYVVDICTTGTGFFKKYFILEYNAFQCSGFYQHDVKDILHVLMRHYCDPLTKDYLAK